MRSIQIRWLGLKRKKRLTVELGFRRRRRGAVLETDVGVVPMIGGGSGVSYGV
jgi:hypothetical protein